METTFVDQVMGDVYDYDYDNKFFISLGNMGNDTMEELQNFLNNKDQKWLWVAGPYWSYRIPTTFSLYREGNRYFHLAVTSDNISCEMVPSLLANQLIISLNGQELWAKQKKISPRQIQSPTLQNQTLTSSENFETITSSSDQSRTDKTVLEKKISQLQTKYR